MDHLVVDVGCPEAGDGTVIWVGGEERGRAGPDLVDVLDDGERLADGPAGVDEDGDLLAHRVGGEEELALVEQVLLQVLVAHALEVQRHAHADRERAHHRAQQLDAFSFAGHRSRPISSPHDYTIYSPVPVL
uniref:Predicted protein n=1 Tax=Hordeum vulgare subsp. vulgare TaxID=112509 RepID=F2DE28_HORVV|nr:predicted protein [Hordeum vulgare subsp. vulgare]